MRLNPKLFDPCYFYARSCFAQGKMEEAVRLVQEGERIESR